jgi:hypothetical protein
MHAPERALAMTKLGVLHVAAEEVAENVAQEEAERIEQEPASRYR